VRDIPDGIRWQLDRRATHRILAEVVMTKEQLYEAALRAVVAQLGQIAPADFKTVGKEKCAEAAFYAAENALMGHNIDGTKAAVEPPAELACKQDGACARQNSVRQMCWPCQMRWHRKNADEIEACLRADEKPPRIEPRGELSERVEPKEDRTPIASPSAVCGLIGCTRRDMHAHTVVVDR
jgi:hypothetical protein